MGRLITPKQAAEHLGVSRKTIYKLIYAGELPAHKIGAAVRIPETAIKNYLQRTRWGTHPISPR